MEKRLQELEKMGKNLCTERMEGEINTETERTSTTTCDNDQSTSCVMLYQEGEGKYT